ncbi:MAG: thiamine phosphate synthase [Candidatus Syntrophosphaera sp.]|nr:thiamine phosphate synthase [Candidatus Syntrophosphaera sp.]
MRDFGLYIVVTQPVIGHLRFTETCVKEEVPILQLREKDMPDREFLKLARGMREIIRGSGTLFFVNDRPDIALLSGADGLHLGPEDLPWQEVAKLIKPGMLLGVSTHSLEQANQLMAERQAAAEGFNPDYMSFGPIFSTPAKAKPDPPVGTDKLAEVIAQASLPVVAIGGIFPENLGEVLSSGARNISMIRQFSLCRDEAELVDNIRIIKSILKENIS